MDCRIPNDFLLLLLAAGDSSPKVSLTIFVKARASKEFCILIANFLEKSGDDYLKSLSRRGQAGFPKDLL